MEDSKSQEEVEGQDKDDGRLAQEMKRSEELLTRLKYLQADFENYRKRAEKEAGEAGESSLRALISSLLSAVDELDLALKNAEEEEKGGGLVDGLKMVQKKLWSSLEAVGLEKIDCVGKAFDPTLHEAVERVHGSGSGNDTVVEEVRPGYVFRNRVIRPSMVKVELAAKRPDVQEAKQE